MTNKAEREDVCTGWTTTRKEVREREESDGGEGIKKQLSQGAGKEDLHTARAALCDDFLFFFCVEEELLLELPVSTH